MRRGQLIKITIVIEVSCDRRAVYECSAEPTILHFYLLFIRIKRRVKGTSGVSRKHCTIVQEKERNKLLECAL